MVCCLAEKVRELKATVAVLRSSNSTTTKAQVGATSNMLLAAPQENNSDKSWHTVTRKYKQGDKGRVDNSKKRGNGLGVQTAYICDASALNVAATLEQPTRKHRGPQWLNMNGLKLQKQTQSESTADQVRPKGPSDEVPVVRHVWVTMRDCSSRTVLTVLQRLSTVAEKVEVRHKF